MSKKLYALIVIFFILLFLIIPGYGVHFFEQIWSFPSNIFDKIILDEGTDPKALTEKFPITSIPLMVIALLGTGIYMTFKLGFPQIKRILHGIKVTKGDYDSTEDEGDLSHFKALSTALAATVGIGNIAGVATAVFIGGPGALFWMWITAFFGTSLKYAECTLALKYRETDSLGNTAGGPMYTIENGLGPKWRWLAVGFACFAVICSFFTGNAVQSNTLTQQVYNQFKDFFGNDSFLMSTKTFTILGADSDISIMHGIIGLITASLVGLVLIGGIRRIGNVTSYLVPGMAAIYVFCSLFIIIDNYDKIGEGFSLIFQMAFSPPSIIEPAVGVSAGVFVTVLNTMLIGVQRGLFSSESGQGSAAIAHSTAKTKHPVREGVVALLEPYIDTIIICTLTGLTIMVTGLWESTRFHSYNVDPFLKTEQVSNIKNEIYNDLESDKKEKKDDDKFFNKSIFLVTHSKTPAEQIVSIVTDIRNETNNENQALNLVEYQISKHDKNKNIWKDLTDYHIMYADSLEANIIVFGVEVDEEIRKKAKEKNIIIKNYTDQAMHYGVSLTSKAFKKGINYGDKMITIAVVLFALSTAISWSFYGDRAIEYLFGNKAIKYYRYFYVFMIFIGALLSVEAVWNFGDAALAFMTFPNLLAIILLSTKLKEISSKYFEKY
tara:strand:- start:490 stop:2478 length:1989 start_codon:yes stop_codon:yes gene_type:complete